MGSGTSQEEKVLATIGYRIIPSKTRKQELIHFGENVRNGERVVIKITNKKDRRLRTEAMIYRKYGSILGKPQCFCYAKEGQYRALVLEKLGPSLAELLNLCSATIHTLPEGTHDRKTFTLPTTLVVAVLAIRTLHRLHSTGFIHGNIQLDNLLTGPDPKKLELYFVGFGFASPFVVDIVEVEEYTQVKSLQKGPDKAHREIPNLCYASINTHRNRLALCSRRDDLESLGYMLVHVIKGTLPWDAPCASGSNSEIHCERVYKSKRETKIVKLCEGLPPCFSEYFRVVMKLALIDVPDYEGLVQLFLRELADMGMGDGESALQSVEYDWTKAMKILGSEHSSSSSSSAVSATTKSGIPSTSKDV